MAQGSDDLIFDFIQFNVPTQEFLRVLLSL